MFDIFFSTNEGNLLFCYLLTLIISIVLAIILRLPLLPTKPYRYSFDVSVLYPTPVIAIGLLSICVVLNYSNYLVAIIVGIFSAIFVKYLFYYVFPNPPEVEENE